MNAITSCRVVTASKPSSTWDCVSEKPTVMVTGASAGIGLAASRALAEDAFVLAVSRTEPPDRSPNTHWVQGDLRDAEAVADRLIRALQAREAGLDGIVYCATSYGSTRRHPFLETREEEWAQIMAVNLHSQFVLTLRLLPLLLRNPRAFLVALSSDVATEPAPGRIAYGCSKAASHALFAGLAAELSDASVAVIQMLPARQVVTRGLRSRRPADFDFSGYSEPDIFKEPLRSILRTRGAGMNGARLVID